jgi:hypothetical protein
MGFGRDISLTMAAGILGGKSVRILERREIQRGNCPTCPFVVQAGSCSMKKLLLCAVACAVLLVGVGRALAQASDPKDLTGQWQGTAQGP